LNHVLINRAAQATADIDAARTPLQKHTARETGMSVKADLEKHIADEQALDAFRKAQPRSMAGVYSGPVADHPTFLVGPGGKKITAPVALPNGEKATPNMAGQIVVEARFVPEMIRRGFVRVNDDAITDRSNGMGMADPARPNNT
jgi:hypothetical protein